MSNAMIDALAHMWSYELRRPAIIRAGTLALHRLIPVALNRTATGKTVGRFLLGLHDGAAYRLDLKHLQQLPQQAFDDCLRVLKMDYMPEVEVQQRVDEGEHVWRELIALWRTQPVEFVGRQRSAQPNTERRATDCSAIKAQGVEAFDRLLQVAEGSTGQSRIVAIFLMCLIHHNAYRFNLNDLRGLDIQQFDDCISVLRMDYLTDTEACKP